jgi:hypothetical protein
MSKQRTLDDIFVRTPKRKHPDTPTDATPMLLPSPAESDGPVLISDATSYERPCLSRINNNDPTTPPVTCIISPDSNQSAAPIMPYHLNDIGNFFANARRELCRQERFSLR